MRGVPRTVVTVSVGVSTLVLAGSANAATFTVTTGTDSNSAPCSSGSCPSLREAIMAADAAGGSSTIRLPAGEYELTIPPSCTSSNGCDADDPDHGDLDVNNHAKVTILGAGPTQTIINANQVDRAFAVQKGASLSLSGAAVENGNPSPYSTNGQSVSGAPGGAIYSDGALTVTDDVFSANGGSSGTYGGAIFVDEDGTFLRISGSTFHDNDTLPSAGGGAISINVKVAASLLVTSSKFFDNGSPAFSDGGAIEVNSGHLTISHSLFRGNDAYAGGAISEGWFNSSLQRPPTSLKIVDSTITESHTNLGGGIAITFGPASVVGTTIADNQATMYGGGGGGGIFDNGGQALSVTNSTIVGNASSAGGAIREASTVTKQTLLNDTIAHNVANAGQGGGLSGVSGLPAGSTVEDTITADNGAGGDCDSGFSASDDLGHNLDSDGTCFGSSHAVGDLVHTNPLLGPLAANGGPTETMALRPGSPAIDRGAAKASCPHLDQRGEPRPDGGESVCDIGAYENQDEVLTVVLAGKGHGRVTGSGIACPRRCSKSFEEDSRLELTAKPAPGSKFAGWAGGGCAGTGSCTVTMAASRRITANFTLVSK